MELPIHHVRFGTGSVKALLVAFPHCMEPIGSGTVFQLMALLHQGNRALLEADVECHIVPCIDPGRRAAKRGMESETLHAWKLCESRSMTSVTGLKAAATTDSAIVTEAMIHVLKQGGNAAEVA